MPVGLRGVVPVLDVRTGQAVHARAGLRQAYAPIDSPLRGSTLLETARRLLQAADSDRLYVADLNALLDAGADSAVSALVHDLTGVTILLDRGRYVETPMPGHVRPVLPLEAGWSECQHAELVARLCPWRPLFSLDLHCGRLHEGYRHWPVATAGDVLPLLERVQAVGYRSVIMVDVSQVGTECGVARLANWVRCVRRQWPELEIVAGGGVRDARDVRQLLAAGADAVLVATALHRGRLGRVPSTPPY
ncbi:MAG: HisA/HisF-related TIM barrel protein [Gemmataceae bacterium]|nr:HisA/HisF-related TIM barrel protein [Gemmataceae bacterium]MDW8242770.1 HisA/HisF-related TIM barrel protein [Thermogemmata sp.]